MSLNKVALSLVSKYKDNYVCINPDLLTEMDAWDSLETIKDLHGAKMVIFEQMERDSGKNLKYYDGVVTEIEFDLQLAWGFPMDKRFHRFWERPQCTCPKLDNEDRYLSSTGYYYTSNCPVHGAS